jgi:hypothetical protein
VIADSGLKEESKKQIKKQTRIKQQPAAVVRSQDGRIPNLRVSEPEQTGSSLRWNVPLTTAEVIASREVLQRIGLNAVVVNGCASAMHPGECWALWCYARSAKLGIPWMASQIYDFAERRARPTFQALAYDDVGKQLAGLPSGEVETMLSFLDDQRLHTQLDLHNNAEYNNRDRAQRSLLDALWAVRTEQHRGGQGNRVEHTTGYMGPVDDAVTMEVDPLWVSVRTQVEKQVEQSDFTTWIAPLALLEVLDEIAVIGAPNVFVRNEVTERFSPLIASVLAETVGHFVDVEVVIGSANGVSQN